MPHANGQPRRADEPLINEDKDHDTAAASSALVKESASAPSRNGPLLRCDVDPSVATEVDATYDSNMRFELGTSNSDRADLYICLLRKPDGRVGVSIEQTFESDTKVSEPNVRFKVVEHHRRTVIVIQAKRERWIGPDTTIP
ncbi:hypothetical protein ACN47E_003167 [Coniothyrium glycines]